MRRTPSSSCISCLIPDTFAEAKDMPAAAAGASLRRSLFRQVNVEFLLDRARVVELRRSSPPRARAERLLDATTYRHSFPTRRRFDEICASSATISRSTCSTPPTAGGSGGRRPTPLRQNSGATAGLTAPSTASTGAAFTARPIRGARAKPHGPQHQLRPSGTATEQRRPRSSISTIPTASANSSAAAWRTLFVCVQQSDAAVEEIAR